MDQHLERQRHEGEIDFLQSNADGANDEGNDKRDRQRYDESHRDGNAGLLHHQPEAVGAKAKEHAMAERSQPSVTDQKVERRREQSIGRAADHEVEQ